MHLQKQVRVHTRHLSACAYKSKCACSQEQGALQGLLAKGFNDWRSGNKVESLTAPPQLTPELLAAFRMRTYFEGSGTGGGVAARTPLVRSKKLEIDEADPDMPLSASWARQFRLRGIFL